jgi:hypothetical protein
MSNEIKSESAKKNEDWMNSKWRPMMGWMYMIVCMADFVLFPVLWSLVQAMHGGRVETQWSPITLNGAGLFHMAMGAILGIAAYGRTQEKLGDKAGATLSVPASSTTPSFGNTGATPSFSSPAPSTAPSSFSGGFTPTPAPKASPVMASNGKLGPAPQDDPIL